MTENNRTSILVAESDVLIRNLISTILCDDGYLVLAAANHAEALELSRSFAGEIRLLVAKSRELAEVIARERPAVRVILLSPFTWAALKEVVRNVDPGSFRHKGALPRELRVSIERALTDPDFGGALLEV